MLTPTVDIIGPARAARSGVGALNVVQIEHAEAIVAGAETVGRPVLLQISESCARYHGALEPITLACKALARYSSVPVGLHLDHAESLDVVREAIELGFTSVMFDGSALSHDENIARTADVVALCHKIGVSVEGALGEVEHTGSSLVPGAGSNPTEAAHFVAATGVDAPAVAVGVSHRKMACNKTLIDKNLIAQLRDAIPVPLALRWSCRLDNRGLAHAVEAGITKVNLSATHLNEVFTTAVRQHLNDNPEATNTQTYFGAARSAVTAEVEQILTVLGQT